MNISIGILAYNEADSISKTLESLIEQSLFYESNTNDIVEVIVVANGCTDQTVEVANLALKKLVDNLPRQGVSWQVCEVADAGKSNAWNLYVHQFSDSNSNYLFLMDADIEFVEPQTLRLMIDKLETTPEMSVAVDLPIKNIAFKKKKNLIDWLSLKGSKSPEKTSHLICGQLYCGRASILRKMYMPRGLTVEDSFLKAMVITDGFTSSEVVERVNRVSGASHVFDAYTSFFSWLHHEKRIVIGSSINFILFSYLWANCNEEQHAGDLIKYNNHHNPRWFHELIELHIAEKGWWVIPSVFLFGRFQKYQNEKLSKTLVQLPFSLAVLFLYFIICFQANSEIRKGNSLGYW